MNNLPMTTEESARFIINLESAGFDIKKWEIYCEINIPTSEYDELFKICDPRDKRKDHYYRYSGFFPDKGS